MPEQVQAAAPSQAPPPSTIPPGANHVSTVRQHLLDQMKALRGADNPEDVRREIDRAKGLSELAQAVVNTAKVEVDYLKATGQTGGSSTFLETPPDQKYIGQTPAPTPVPGPAIAFPGPWPAGKVTRHVLPED